MISMLSKTSLKGVGERSRIPLLYELIDHPVITILTATFKGFIEGEGNATK
jgi:hypothetical protein